MESKMDRDKWYAIIFDALRRIFGDDSFGAEELERRKRLYGDPRVSTIIRAYLSRFVGVVSFSADPLNPAMWAYYAQNTGFVIGYRTSAMRARGLDLRRVLYLELAPVYTPTRDDIVRLQFVDEERRDQDMRDGHAKPDIKPLLSADADLLELRQDWNELAKVLFIKGQAWSHEQEVRLLVNLHNTRVGRPPIRERTLAGLTAARARGRNGGRTFALSKAQVRLAQAAMAHRDTSVSALCRELGIRPVTLSRYVGPQGQLREQGV